MKLVILMCMASLLAVGIVMPVSASTELPSDDLPDWESPVPSAIFLLTSEGVLQLDESDACWMHTPVLARLSALNSEMYAFQPSDLSQGGHDPCRPMTNSCPGVICETKCTRWREGYFDKKCQAGMRTVCHWYVGKGVKRKICNLIAHYGCWVPRSCVGEYKTECRRK